MLNKQTVSVISLLSLGFSASSTQALDCTIVAEIYPTDAIQEVMIDRDKAKNPWATTSQQLCAGQLVTAPNRPIQPLITIRYYTNPPTIKKLQAGKDYRIETLDKPCGTACTVWNDLKRFYHKLTSSVPENLSDGIGGGREASNAHEPSPVYDISMPLDAGEGFDYPFYLFARQGAIPLFWEDGQPPYQLEVTDATSNVIVRNTLKTNQFSLTVPNTTPAQTYTLTISSAESVPYQKQLVFAKPPFLVDSKVDQLPVDKLYILARLLSESDKNWRLEIWRQLASLPETQRRKNFETHLILDDIDL